MNRTIEVTISATGETHIQTHGFAGGACRQASQFIEQALGAKVQESLTSEFYALTTQQHSNAGQSNT